MKALFDVSVGKNYGDFNTFAGTSSSVGGNFLIVGSGEMFTQRGTPYGNYVRAGEVGIGASVSTSTTCVRSLRMSSGC